MIDGNITNTSVGKVWTLRISIPNALNIGFIFNQFNLSANAEMYIFDEARTVLDSGIKQAHFTNPIEVGIFPIKGNSAIIYIIEPNNFGDLLSSVSIQTLEAGFQEIDDVGDTGGQSQRASVNCNPHVQCQPDKMMSARAVARFVVGGHECTGTLLNNEVNNGRAFFLGAFHCLDHNKNKTLDPAEINELAAARFQFQFWRTVCNGTVNNRFIQFNGAVLRASYENSDMILLELIDAPGIGDGVNYAGWNRQTSPSSNDWSFILHHPQGVDMRVTSTRNVSHYL